jgi:phosphoglycerate-specific signal transduction histidine kinase
LIRFDFDAWRELAVRDPAEYFRERERTLEAFIAERPESEQGLRALQGEIDRVRALSGSPAQAARELARMLGERLEALAAHVQQLDAQVAVLRELTLRPPD